MALRCYGMKKAWVKFVVHTAVMLVGVVMVLFGYVAFDRAARYQRMSEEMLVMDQSFQSWSCLKEMQKKYRGEKCVSLAVVSGGFLLVFGMGTLLVSRRSATRKSGFVAVSFAFAVLVYAAISSTIYKVRRSAIIQRDGARINAEGERIAAEYLTRPDLAK